MIVGEVDVPGHATACPNDFRFRSDSNSSDPTRLGVIDFTSDAMIARPRTIFDEISTVFPSEYIHMGGNEVSFKVLECLPEVISALGAANLTRVYDLYRLSIARMRDFAASRNKTLIVWEGFGPIAGQPVVGHEPTPGSVVRIPADGVQVSFFDGVYYITLFKWLATGIASSIRLTRPCPSTMRN